MQPDSGAHRRHARSAAGDKWRQIVDRYRRSDLTQREFCQQAGIPLSTLNWWLTKARRQADAPTRMAFTEVRLPASLVPPIPPTQTWALEIVTRDGVTIRCRDPLSVPDLAQLLRDAGC